MTPPRNPAADLQARPNDLRPIDGAANRPPLLSSADLLRGSKVAEIDHNGERYRLQATRLGKLILTK